ncbi:FtsK/SpoIIIE domain-containing protein [Yinghuangia aomiensis]
MIGRVAGEVGTRLSLVGPGAGRLEDVVADAVSPAWADRFARAVAPLREAASRAVSPLPETVRLLDLLGLDLMTPAKVQAAWREDGRSTRTVLGADVRGAVTADLDTDGPHAVIAGAAGVGKTELLTALVSSLRWRTAPTGSRWCWCAVPRSTRSPRPTAWRCAPTCRTRSATWTSPTGAAPGSPRGTARGTDAA